MPEVCDSRRQTARLRAPSRRLSACSWRTSCSSSSRRLSGAGKGSESRGDRLDRALDVLVRDPEVSRRPQDARPEVADENAVVGDPLSRFRKLDFDLDADEIRLDRLGVDEEPGGRQALGEASGAAVATIPAWRIAPPKRNLPCQASSIRSAEEASTAPSGQPSPFERQR